MKLLKLTLLVLFAVVAARGQIIPSNNNVTVIGTVTVAGGLTNNNAAPSTNNIGVLPALANATAPTWTEGDMVLLSVDLKGAQRVRGGLTHNNAAPAALSNVGVLPAIANASAPTFTEGDQVLLSTDLSGNLRTSASVTLSVSTCTGTQKSQAWIAVPTVATAVTSTTACIDAINVTNTNSSTQTILITDGQGSPITMVATYVIPGNSTVVFPFHYAPSTTGFKWTAGGTGLTGSAHWLE